MLNHDIARIALVSVARIREYIWSEVLRLWRALESIVAIDGELSQDFLAALEINRGPDLLHARF